MKKLILISLIAFVLVIIGCVNGQFGIVTVTNQQIEVNDTNSQTITVNARSTQIELSNTNVQVFGRMPGNDFEMIYQVNIAFRNEFVSEVNHVFQINTIQNRRFEVGEGYQIFAMVDVFNRYGERNEETFITETVTLNIE